MLSAYLYSEHKSTMPKSIAQYRYLIVIYFLALSACKSGNKGPILFETLESKATGLNFTNHLVSNDSFNLFKYMYFYNGAGVGAGDLNNDGLTDLFFASNQGQNTLYLNEGGLHFKDVTNQAQIPSDTAWNTGVSLVDINQDGLLDIYICRVGKYRVLSSKNQLLVCQGIDKNGVPFYNDKASEYGLDFSGFSTQAAFFDYDLDGDLDMFLLNHSVHENGTFRPRQDFLGTFHELSGDRMFRNDNGHFTDVTHQSGINSSAISYGLGIVISDINLDGYPDVYVGNDFHENDYLYINQKNGTFKETLNDEMMHTSQFTMGVDAADADNDGYPDIISVDMLPADPYILKRSLGEDEYDIFNRKIGYGYNYQYTRNNLQYNRKNNLFSEIGLYSGVAATDWSWSPLWVDFDNDGLKDLFISNGIPKRMNDIDYINFVSDQEVQQKIQDNKIDETDETLIDKFPQIKLPNKFYHNAGKMQFTDLDGQIGNDQATYSNGAVSADFDNDGDIDIVVNNIDAPALLYKNTLNDKQKTRSMLLQLQGAANNRNAIGAKVILYANQGVHTYEKYPVHGFLSSIETPLTIGLGNMKIDSMFLIWPDNTFQKVEVSGDTTTVLLKYVAGLPAFDYETLKNYQLPQSFHAQNITAQTGLQYMHKENPFQEFDREPLIPHMLSTAGPAIAIADINHDNLDDVFIGSSKGNKSAIFLQTPAGRFQKLMVPVLDNDSTFEESDACWADVNNDGNLDLVVANGGNEYYGNDANLSPHIYLNDGKANFTVLQNAFNKLFVNASSIAPYDFNGDGYMDLFVGGRSVPWNYGETPRSYLLINDKTGRFREVTNTVAPGLNNIGFVTQGSWVDIDKDGDNDLLLSLEWGGIVAFINSKGHFLKQTITDKKGWWNFVTPCDVDNDGDIDLVAGNLGTNSRLKATAQQPVKLYFNDFDNNGKQEQVLTYFVQGKEIPFANKAELEKQMPYLKKKFLYAKDFAQATLTDIFTKEKLQGSQVLTADYFCNVVLINDGKQNFSVQPLPWQAQLTPYRDAVVADFNGDNLPDVLLVGNFYENNIEMGRYDADFGTVLLNKGHSFVAEPLQGVQLKGQTRHIRKLLVGNKVAYITARNNDSTLLITIPKK